MTCAVLQPVAITFTVLGYCQVCEVLREFPTVVDRNCWERSHEHGGSD